VNVECFSSFWKNYEYNICQQYSENKNFVFKIPRYIYVISELHSVEGQSNLPTHLQQGRFCVKYNMHRRVFAWRHLEAGQYVAQSGLHLHQSETHSCKGNEKKSGQEIRNASGFKISLNSPSIAFNKMYYGTRNRDN
jgi:hypothetical protein